ncbi:hypothetical protein BpHYR1_006626 [Brachionus plicatilis]|uniref:Uncharacterized protein n=1 Tax=Brachionus plicatilis TaxID=10195 RepID=A0A3M7PM14_BRAPC|nr:hypothetical protein BpHYR1_006626 [Brachionus plicatilis]
MNINRKLFEKNSLLDLSNLTLVLKNFQHHLHNSMKPNKKNETQRSEEFFRVYKTVRALTVELPIFLFDFTISFL